MVDVILHTRLKGVTISWVKRVVAETLAYERRTRENVGVLLTDDRKIRVFNKRYLRHNRATDVIAFNFDEKGILGDVVVSVETAGRTAKALGIPFKEELARYLVHGTLHLCGYEDKAKTKRDRMHARQETILKKL